MRNSPYGIIVPFRTNATVNKFCVLSCAIEIARNADLRIACPYVSLEYLGRLINLTKESNSWKLLTDIHAWLASLNTDERKQCSRFC